MTTKFYTNRDSATAFLRKAGIGARDYPLYIEKYDGGYRVRIPEALVNTAARLASDLLALQKGAAERIKKEEKRQVAKATPPKVKSPGKEAIRAGETSQSTIISLINKNKTNDEVFKLLQGTEFELPESKRRYIGWYRSNMKIGKRFAHLAN